MNGGYTMVDCKGINLLADSAVTVTGIYSKCAKAISTKKPIIAYNLEWGEGVAVTPVPVFIVPFEGYFVCTASTLQVIVTTADSVTVVNMAPANG